MVKYYGRARQRIGSVNTNQIGLKMSGCPSKVGRQGYLSRYIARRAQCNQKYCGPVYYHGVLWKWNSGRCVAKAPRGQSFNSGVGHKSTPRFACGNTCATELTLDAAFDIIFKYFSALADPNGYIPALVGTKETLKSDLGDVHDTLLKPIQHLEPGNTYYDNAPPAVKKAILSVNRKDLTFKIKGNLRKHIIGLVTTYDESVLYDNGFGIKLKLSPTSVVVAFGDGGDDCGGIRSKIKDDPDNTMNHLCNTYNNIKNYMAQKKKDDVYLKAQVTMQVSSVCQPIWNPCPLPSGIELTPYPEQDNGPQQYGTTTYYTNVTPINVPCEKNDYLADIVLTIRTNQNLEPGSSAGLSSILSAGYDADVSVLAGPTEPDGTAFSYYYCPIASGTYIPSTKEIKNVKRRDFSDSAIHKFVPCS